MMAIADKFICLPTTKECDTMKKAIWKKYLLPNCIGIIDGSHIPFCCKPTESSAYYNFKGFTSLNLLALVDNLYRFRYVLCGKFYFIRVALCMFSRQCMN